MEVGEDFSKSISLASENEVKIKYICFLHFKNIIENILLIRSSSLYILEQTHDRSITQTSKMYLLLNPEN